MFAPVIGFAHYYYLHYYFGFTTLLHGHLFAISFVGLFCLILSSLGLTVPNNAMSTLTFYNLCFSKLIISIFTLRVRCWLTMVPTIPYRHCVTNCFFSIINFDHSFRRKSGCWSPCEFLWDVNWARAAVQQSPSRSLCHGDRMSLHRPGIQAQ
jgi:hypothetical protein